MTIIEKYFSGERIQCIAGIVFSLLTILLAIYLLKSGKSFQKGMSFPFFVFPFLLLVICTLVVLRTPSDVRRVQGFFQSETTKIKTDELPRMEKVMTTFELLKKVELIIAVLGLLVLLMFKNDLVRGIAAGTTIQGLLLFLFDWLAANRGETYINFLREL